MYMKVLLSINPCVEAFWTTRVLLSLNSERQLFVRIKEHAAPNNSAVFKHIENNAYYKNYNNIYYCVEVIKVFHSYFSLLFTEALLISKKNTK